MPILYGRDTTASIDNIKLDAYKSGEDFAKFLQYYLVSV